MLDRVCAKPGCPRQESSDMRQASIRIVQSTLFSKSRSIDQRQSTQKALCGRYLHAVRRLAGDTFQSRDHDSWRSFYLQALQVSATCSMSFVNLCGSTGTATIPQLRIFFRLSGGQLTADVSHSRPSHSCSITRRMIAVARASQVWWRRTSSSARCALHRHRNLREFLRSGDAADGFGFEEVVTLLPNSKTSNLFEK